VGSNRNTLLRKRRTELVNRRKGWKHAIEVAEDLVRVSDSRIAVVRRRLRWRNRSLHLPTQGRTIVRVLRNQVEQNRRSGPGEPHDENRPLDDFPLELRMGYTIFLQAEPIFEIAEKRLSTAQTTEGREIGFTFERIEQHRHPLAKAVAPKVVGSGAPNRGTDEILLVERRPLHAQGVEGATDAIEGSDPEGTMGLRERHDFALDSASRRRGSTRP